MSVLRVSNSTLSPILFLKQSLKPLLMTSSKKRLQDWSEAKGKGKINNKASNGKQEEGEGTDKK